MVIASHLFLTCQPARLSNHKQHLLHNIIFCRTVPVSLVIHHSTYFVILLTLTATLHINGGLARTRALHGLVSHLTVL